MLRFCVLLVAMLLSYGCFKLEDPKLDETEIKDLLLKPSRGVLGGFEVGDSWDKIKTDHDARWRVDEGRHALIHGADANGVRVSFMLDQDQKVTCYIVNIEGRESSDLIIAQLASELSVLLDGKLGSEGTRKPGEKNGSYTYWEKQTKEGLSANLNYRKWDDRKGGYVEIRIFKDRCPGL